MKKLIISLAIILSSISFLGCQKEDMPVFLSRGKMDEMLDELQKQKAQIEELTRRIDALESSHSRKWHDSDGIIIVPNPGNDRETDGILEFKH